MATGDNIIRVSAPGNVMLMGEHAVLLGHRAIVCAVSQRLHLSLTPRNDTRIIIQSALANYETDTAKILDKTHDVAELSFVLESIRAVLPDAGFDLLITSEFSHTVGLGSSAAVVAACVAALLRYQQGHAEADVVFDVGLQVIHAVQKRGSGSDLAASVYGGMVGYTANPRQISPLLSADDLSPTTCPRLDLFYSGYKTPTPEVLALVEAKSAQFPDIYQSLYQQMHAVSLAAEQAIANHDWQALGKLMNIYHGLMDALGVSDAKLSELVYQTREYEGVLGAKISGSGLGDCAISLSAPSSPPMACQDDAHIDAVISPRGIIFYD